MIHAAARDTDAPQPFDEPTGHRSFPPAPDGPQGATEISDQSRGGQQPVVMSAIEPPHLPLSGPMGGQPRGRETQWIPTEPGRAGPWPRDPRLAPAAKAQAVATSSWQQPATAPPTWFAAAAAAIGSATLAASSAQKSARQLKDVLDQSDLGTLVAFTKAEMAEAKARHIQRTGVEAEGDIRPSAEQLGALRTRLAAGGCPHVDFSVWGPHDRRHAKDHRTMALVPTALGLQPRLLSGPPHFEAWDQAWAVFGAAMLSLGAASVGALGRYRKGIRALTLLYPSLWGVVSRADEAMRFEQWPVMAEEEDPQGDWSGVISASAWGEYGLRQFFWDTHVSTPATQTNPHHTIDQIEGYTPRGGLLGHSPADTATSQPSHSSSPTVRRQPA